MVTIEQPKEFLRVDCKLIAQLSIFMLLHERFDDIIKNGVKETWGYEKQPQVRVNEVINVGIKETNWRKVDNHPTYVDNIIDKKTLL